jgi:hypothetical protein
VIALDVADLVVISGRALGTDTDTALDELDVAAARAALAEAACPGRARGAPAADRADAAAAGVALVRALLRHRPFPRDGDRVAVAAGLQFLAVNGWRADLDPPAIAAVVVEALASGRLSTDGAAAWLSPRLAPRPGVRRLPLRAPLRSLKSAGGPGAATARGGRTLAGVLLTLTLGGLVALTTACSYHGPAGHPGGQPVTVRTTIGPVSERFRGVDAAPSVLRLSRPAA